MDAGTKQRFAIAMALGMTVDELNCRLPVSEFVQWGWYLKECRGG